MDFMQHILSLLIWLPIIGGVALVVIGDDNDVASARAGLMRMAALAISVVTFLISIVLYVGFAVFRHR